MKTKWIVIVMVAAVMMMSSVAMAKPERLEIKSNKATAQEEQAKQKIKAINVNRISDPEARKAIKEILIYLNLPTTN